MSKNIKGKNIDINLNITQSGTFNAEIFNASNDFTLNGFSIVSRIINNETNIAMLQIDINEADAEIVELQNNKQDKLTIQQSITPSTTEIASSSAIINYVNSQVPEIIAISPLSYSSGTLSGIFDLNPTLNSNNFLNSGKIYNALQTKQNTITSATPISCSYITASNAVTVNNGSITCVTGNIQAVSGNITTATGSITAPTIIQSGTNLLTAIQSNTTNIDTINTTLVNKQDTITQSTNLECGLLSSNNLTAREGNIFCLLGDIRAIDGDILTNTGTISTLLGTISAPIIIQDGVNLLNEINTKQDILNIIQTITTSQTSIPSSYAVFNYLDGVYIPTLISATAPINYSTTTGIISGSFDLSPTIGSNNFLSSGVISSALSGKQDTISSETSLSCGDLTSNSITNTGLITTNSISNTGLITTENIIGDISANLQAGPNIFLETTGGITTISAQSSGVVPDPLTINTINSTTINNAGTITTSILNGNISNNLESGLNTSLSTSTSTGITKINSILTDWISLIVSSNYSPGSGTAYNIIYDTTLSGNLSYNGSTGQVTIPSTGLYSISGSLVFDISSGSSRVNTRIRMRVNNNFTGGYAQAYGYSRFATEVSLSTATFPEWIGPLVSGDVITMRAEIAVGTNNQFSSPWTGYSIQNGSALTIKKVG